MTRILIVDDERDIRTTLAYNLTYAGFRVLEAGNAFDAVDATHALLTTFVIGADGSTNLVYSTADAGRTWHRLFTH